MRIILWYFPGMQNENIPLEGVKISYGGECDNFSHILPFLSYGESLFSRTMTARLSRLCYCHNFTLFIVKCQRTLQNY